MSDSTDDDGIGRGTRRQHQLKKISTTLELKRPLPMKENGGWGWEEVPRKLTARARLPSPSFPPLHRQSPTPRTPPPCVSLHTNVHPIPCTKSPGQCPHTIQTWERLYSINLLTPECDTNFLSGIIVAIPHGFQQVGTSKKQCVITHNNSFSSQMTGR